MDALISILGGLTGIAIGVTILKLRWRWEDKRDRAWYIRRFGDPDLDPPPRRM